MADPEHPQIYLITPPEIDIGRFPDVLARVLDAQPVACVRVAQLGQDEDKIARSVDACREVTMPRDVALVIDSHIMLVERLGLDGVHLLDGARSVRAARRELGPDAIIGSYCSQSRHEGMAAAEAGADYVSFGPVGASQLGDGARADTDLFAWWSDVIEIPVVAEGALDTEIIRTLSPITDFFGFGEELWSSADPVAQLGIFIDAMS